jgi:predicted XRE-type DNA-binding protein
MALKQTVTVSGNQIATQDEPLVIEKSSGNLFADFGFSKTEAVSFVMRTDCIIAIEAWFKSSGLTEAMAATQLGVTQPRFNAMLKGAIEQFSIDALVNMAASAGIAAKLTLKAVKKKAA